MMLKSEWQFLKQHKMMLVVMYDADRTYRRPCWAIGWRGRKAAVISTNTATPAAWLAIISMTIGFNLLIILKFHLEMKRQPLGA